MQNQRNGPGVFAVWNIFCGIQPIFRRRPGNTVFEAKRKAMQLCITRKRVDGPRTAGGFFGRRFAGEAIVLGNPQHYGIGRSGNPSKISRAKLAGRDGADG